MMPPLFTIAVAWSSSRLRQWGCDARKPSMSDDEGARSIVSVYSVPEGCFRCVGQIEPHSSMFEFGDEFVALR